MTQKKEDFKRLNVFFLSLEQPFDSFYELECRQTRHAFLILEMYLGDTFLSKTPFFFMNQAPVIVRLSEISIYGNRLAWTVSN